MSRPVIRRNEIRIDNPFPCEEDGPVYQLRRWHEQVYVDVVDAPPATTDRFEFERDTISGVLDAFDDTPIRAPIVP